MDPNTAAQLEADKENGYDYALWTGQIKSVATQVNVGDPAPASCTDCHGKKDYHHLKSHGCTDCHVGEVGEDDFDIKPEACAQCHPRPGQQGRRLILGRDGEFSQASRHVYGRIEDSDCLKCHDASGHKSGVVNLIDPSTGQDQPWQGTGTGFCLTCHGQASVGSVTFPRDTQGSGYHKAGFGQSTHAKWLGDQSCAHCHVSHGSPHPALLRGPFAVDSEQATDDVDTDYGLCWLCHDQDTLLAESNAFAKLHGLHVESEDIGCATCHDTHASTDPGEPGLIKLQANEQSGFRFLGNHNESSAFAVTPDATRGSCYVTCHADKQPRSYARKHKGHTVACLNCH